MKKLDDKGNIAIILSLVVAALFGLTAYVIDIGLTYAEKVKLSNALDAAVLAASLELPKNPTKAREVAKEYLQKNSVDPNKAIITISDDNKAMQIEESKNVNHFFAPIFGVNNSNVKAKTKAIIAPVKSVKDGIRPFAVELYNFTYGDRVTLKEDAGDGYHGNYGAVALGASGAFTFRQNALYGYNGVIKVGDIIPTEPGDKASVANDIKNYINSDPSNFENFERDSLRIWTVPLVDSLMVDGRAGTLVVGFGEFFVEDVTHKSGKIEITGRFIRYVANGAVDTNLSDTGAYGVKLVK